MLDPTGLAVAAAAMAIAQLVKGVTGFGSALVAMPVLLLLLDPADAILVMAVTDVFAGAWLIWDVWPRIRWVLVLSMFVGTVPGQWVGTGLLDVLDEVWVRRALGALVASMGASFALRPVVHGRGELTDLPAEPGRLLVGAAIAGIAAGAMGGLVGASGPPMIAFCKRHFEDQFFRAQLVVFFQLSSLALALLLLSRGARLETLGIVPWMLIPVFVGNRSGAFLAPRVSRVVFGRVTGLVLVASGLALLR
ncbi:MAG: sulfite exporter TauE/SafE family protein [Myxococcota bacterium]